MDASNVYGSDVATGNALKDTTGGRMKTQSGGKLLPQLGPHPDSIGCSPLNDEEPCFHAGDDRNGVNMGLNAMHTLWVYEHNRIAAYFASRTGWTNDQIYFVSPSSTFFVNRFLICSQNRKTIS